MMTRRRYLLLLIALVAIQTVARLAFHRFTFGLSLWGFGTHLMIVAGWLVLALLIVAHLPERWRGVPVAAAAAVLLLGASHALVTYFDLGQIVWHQFVRMRGPVWLPFTDPDMAMALLESIDIGAGTVIAVLGGLLLLHLLLWLPVAGEVARLSRQAMQLRLSVRGRTVRGDALALALLLLIVIARFALPGIMWRAEPFRNGSAATFLMAPAPLMTGAGAEPKRIPPQPPLTHPRPVILIIADALRRDRTGVYTPALNTTPFLDRLRDEGKLHIVPAPYATCTFSFCGIMSVLASRSWDDFGAAPPTVIDMLGRHGYRSYVLLAGRQRGFGRLPLLYGDTITLMRDQDQLGADDSHVVRWLGEIDFPDPRRSFLYLHLMATHGAVKLGPGFGPERGDKAPYPERYLGMVRQTDATIERIFAVLQAKGLLDDAIVIITSDHGEMLGEGGRWFHGGPPHEAAIGVPILIYDAAGGVWPERPFASTIDVAPTLLRAVGGRPGPGWRGQPLQDAPRVEAVPIGTAELTGAIVRLDGRTYKYLCRRDNGAEHVRLIDGSENGTMIKKTEAPLDRLRAAHRQVAGPPSGPYCR